MLLLALLVLCKAFHAGRETELPVKSGKKERRIEKRIVITGDADIDHDQVGMPRRF